MSIKSCVKFFVFVALCVVWGAGFACADEFEKLERGHFVVYHYNRNLANKLSWKAEYHYKRIIRHFGVSDFKPWEGAEKCPIYLYSTRQDFIKATGAPDWASGLAQYSPFRFSTYEDADNVLVDTLPHEMTHMLFHLFMNGKPIPLWLNEGLAQFEEEDPNAVYRRKRWIKHQVREKTYIPLKELFGMSNIPQDRVDLFYCESASIVDHLITANIRTNFGRFITLLKKGYHVEAALKKAYQWKYKNGIGDLERQWGDYVSKKY